MHDIIDKANAMVTVTGFSGVYDGNPHGVVSSSAKGVNNEDLTGLSIAPTTYTNVPGGLIHWTFTNQNYADQAGDATVTITKAAATIVVNSYSVTYDGHPTYGHRLGHGRPRRKSDRAGSERYRPHQCGRLSERSMDVYRQHWQLQQ